MMMASEPPLFPFDRVVILEPSGSSRDMSPSEFFALPLAKRIQFVVQQKAAFFAGQQKVDSKEALAQMRKIRAQWH
jgi:hypothetical protein